MLTMHCDDVRRDLSAYHDEELPVGQRIAIHDHLANCPGCALEANDLLAMRDALQAAARGTAPISGAGFARLQSDILERVAAEERVAMTTWVRELLEDRRRAFMTAGAAIAACLLIIAGVCQLTLGTNAHPDSLASLIEHEERLWAARAERPVMQLPRVDAESVMPAAVMNQSEGDESYSAFWGIVTSQGGLAQLQFLGDDTEPARASRKQLPADYLAAAATASFQPASKDGIPVPVTVIWVVTHRTVRAPLHARVAVKTTFRAAKTA
jgi:anti-sigma factor RsiW